MPINYRIGFEYFWRVKYILLDCFVVAKHSYTLWYSAIPNSQ